MVTDKDYEIYETLVAYSKANKDFKQRFQLSEAFAEQKDLYGYRRAAEVLRDASSDMILPQNISKALSDYISGLDSLHGTLQSAEAFRLYDSGYINEARIYAQEALKHITKDSFVVLDFNYAKNELERIVRQ